MEMFPETSALGKLKIIEVYEYYDRPVLFACQSITDALYLVVLLEEDFPREKWLLVNVSKQRFFQIRSGGIDLHDAFSESENGVVTILEIDNETFTIVGEKTVKASKLTENELPELGERLLLETATLPPLEQDRQLLAKQTRREQLLLHLDFANSYRTEAPAAVTGKILSTLQDVLDAIGQALVGNPTERGIIPADIAGRAKLTLVGVGPGSFQLELASDCYVNLFEESDTGTLLDELVFLIDLSSKPEELQDQLTHLKIRAASKYLEFLRAMSVGVKEARVVWTSPREGKGRNASLTSEQVTKAILAIESAELQKPEEFVLIGQLVGANMVKKTYEIVVVNPENKSKETYSGKVDGEALDHLDGATIGMAYLATIRKVTAIKQLTGEVDDKYLLIKLESLN